MNVCYRGKENVEVVIQQELIQPLILIILHEYWTHGATCFLIAAKMISDQVPSGWSNFFDKCNLDNFTP